MLEIRKRGRSRAGMGWGMQGRAGEGRDGEERGEKADPYVSKP